MDTQETLSKSHELPQPTSEAVTPGSASPEAGQSPEQQTVASSSSSASVTTLANVGAQQLTADPQATTAATAVTSHLSAQDADLIEKEWVLKAKEIVARTHGDPYVQNNEINKIKADYIKKRYNKDIKQSAN